MVSHTAVIGRTGTGKTYYLKQQLKKFDKLNVKCLVMDIEGDFTGIKRTNLKNLKEDFKRHNVLRVQGSEEKEKQNMIYDFVFKNLKNIIFVIDEINSQGGREKSLNPSLERLFIRGRKRGIKIIVAGQRASLISKTILSSCTIHVLKKQGWENDYKVYNQLNKHVSDLIKDSKNKYVTTVLKDGILYKLYD
ncbi:ATP-binding protein [Methanococcus voltae]|uniref:Helicase HerA central domain-containing protein n=1 Tax=Methanococcus voltae (strain ATCC BAA-1334 / A3) TaxID=456320 RepID=D7DSL4_METV3|nr:helicase HerA-like domain-containing protein [Methanococcus voltae]MCS3901723.1 DNA helicase HerA-like ATPase [Methanococcus voltae]